MGRWSRCCEDGLRMASRFLCDVFSGQIYDLDFKNEGGGAAEMKKSVPQLIEYYKSWLSKYPFVSIEAGCV